jgi:hypothetical protein
VAEGAHQYEFGDMGNLLVLVGDEQPVDSVRWSKDRGQTWYVYCPQHIRWGLTTFC